MLKKNKKIINILLCASILSSGGFTLIHENTPLVSTVQAAKKRKRKQVGTRSYGVDVAAYQSGSVKRLANAGAKFAIVKVSEGTGYRNPKAAAQISSAISAGMLPMAYHFALFGGSSAAARREARYAASSAKSLGLPLGSYIACDWESGDGNNVNAGKAASARAIIAFMKLVNKEGYQPLLYSGASLLRNNISTSKVTKAFPDSLWVASYATMGRINNPDFSYFPSMNGVAIWQFTDNWRGLNVDGNISLLPLTMSGASSQAPKAKAITSQKVMMTGAEAYNKQGKKTAKEYQAGKKITVYGGLLKIKGRPSYRVGKNIYLPVSAVDGVKRLARVKTAVYTGAGKVAATIAKGATVVTGTKKLINGITYYRINKNRYVKASALK